MRIDVSTLKQYALNTLTGLGCHPAEAEAVSEHLIEANLCGHDSHGVGMLPFYVDSCRRGTLKVNQVLSTVQDYGAILQYDAHRGFGQYLTRQAVDQALGRVADTGVCLLTVRNAHHMGRIGSYGEQVAAAGQVGLFFVNVVDCVQGFVAPFGGAEGRFGTNPICIAYPAGQHHPAFLLDFATSMVAYNKTRVAYLAGTRFEQAVMVDANGLPSTDPAVMHTPPFGALLPMGEHKGGGLIGAVEFLAGLLSGGGTNQPQNPRLDGIINHMTAIIIDPKRLGDWAWMQAEYDAMSDFIQATPPAAGVNKVMMAGEPERLRRQQRAQEGIEISTAEWQAIVAAAEQANAQPSSSHQESQQPL